MRTRYFVFSTSETVNIIYNAFGDDAFADIIQTRYNNVDTSAICCRNIAVLSNVFF